MLIKIDTHEYPVSEQDFTNRHPNISFPTAIPYDDFGYAVVFPTPQPETDWYHFAREIAPALTDKGHWEQQWEIIEIQRTPEEVAAKQRSDILAQITALESQQTPRMLREAALDINGGKELLAGINAQIEALRTQLPTT